MTAGRLDLTDLRGWGLLAFDATLGLTGVVEAMHHAISRVALPVGPPPPGRPRGITGFVYRSIHGVTRVAAAGFDVATGRGPAGECLEERRSPRREVVLATLNGVIGDYLAETRNPLALPMRLRHGGRALLPERGALASAIPEAGPKLVVLVHGACQNDLRWQRLGHDHGAALARDRGFVPIHLHYNTGLHVSTNGRAFAALLEQLVRAWPVELEELAILAHSMGGLVARSACHYAAEAGHAWLGRTPAVICLGTPHLGAPLERGGSWVDVLLGLSPYAAPIGRVGRIRSAGVTDLRHGSLVDEDWAGRDRFARRSEWPRAVPPLPGVRLHLVAATLAPRPSVADRLVGDGLVPLESALGEHRDPARCLGVPDSRRFVARGLNHWDLLSDPGVYARILGWLAR